MYDSTPHATIIPTPDDLPAVVPHNVDASLVGIDFALAALDRGGHAMEHHDGPYGAVYEAAKAVIERAYPEMDAEAVMTERHMWGNGIVGALAAERERLAALTAR